MKSPHNQFDGDFLRLYNAPTPSSLVTKYKCFYARAQRFASR